MPYLKEKSSHQPYSPKPDTRGADCVRNSSPRTDAHSCRSRARPGDAATKLKLRTCRLRRGREERTQRRSRVRCHWSERAGAVGVHALY